MNKTNFLGLTVLDENDSIYTDGASFLRVNPVLTDRAAEVGMVTHRHDAHSALPNPTASASAGVSPTGGAIAPDLPVYIAFTLVDDEGGETVLAPATSVTTQAAYDAPSSEITASASYDSGTLVADTYYYAITLLDAGGGQTTLGPTVTVERAPGYASGRVLLSGLDNDFATDGAVAWRLYRAIGGGDWAYIAQGSTDSFIDDGLDCADTSVLPPLADTQNSTNHTNLLRVILPTDEPSLASAAAMRLYLSTDGDFQSPSFYEQFPTASAGQVISVPALSVTEGAPPDVSTCFPGASQIDPDTDILDWHWKRPVATSAALGSGAVGDVRLATDTGVLYGVLGASAGIAADWVVLGSAGSGSGSSAGGHVIAEFSGFEYPPRSRLAFRGYNVWVSDQAGNEQQAIDLNATAGSFTLTFDGQTTTSLAYSATGATIQAALEALSNIAPGDILVSGGPIDFIVLFLGTGAYAETDVPQITVDATSLTTTGVTTSTLEGHVPWTEVEVPGGHEEYFEAAALFAANWSDFGGIYVPTRYWTEDAGTITHIMGHIKRSSAPTAGETIFVLPVGFRPLKAHTFAVAAGDSSANTRAFGSVDILPAGDVKWYAGAVGGSANQFISLDGVSFPVGY